MKSISEQLKDCDQKNLNSLKLNLKRDFPRNMNMYAAAFLTNIVRIAQSTLKELEISYLTCNVLNSIGFF